MNKVALLEIITFNTAEIIVGPLSVANLFRIKDCSHINTLRPTQKTHHMAGDIFTCIFLNENVCTSIKILLKFVPNVPINNIPALVQKMAWRRPGVEPLSEPIMVSLTTNICVTRPKLVKRVLLSNRQQKKFPKHLLLTTYQYESAV